MALVSNNIEESLFVDSDSGSDDDFEILSAPPCPAELRPTRNSTRHAMALPGLPQMQTASTQTTSQPPITRTRPERAAAPRRSQNAPTASVIDLTEEPDSPEVIHQQTIPIPSNSRTQRFGQENQIPTRDHRSTSTNPRRTNSVRRTTPPRLARSDEAMLGGGDVIDLTADDEPDLAQFNHPGRQPSQRPTAMSLFQQRRERMSRGHLARRQYPPHWHGSLPGFDSLIDVTTDAGTHRVHDSQFGRSARLESMGMLARTLGGLVNFAGGGGRGLFVNLDVTRNAGEGIVEPVPPQAEPIATARSGFSRDTKMTTEDDEDTDIAVCPTCDQELAYDPTELVKKVTKGKRKPGDHHFWALKACGHVYCADCFEGRSKKTSKAKFPLTGGSSGDPLCAVDGCSSAAKNKSQWVGIFL